jgi:nitroreductase
MDIPDLIRTRRSKRAFKDEPVDKALLAQVIEDASNAPSALNMQPWEVHMVLGEERKRLSLRLLRAYRERNLTCGPGGTKVIPDRFIERARICAEGMDPLAEEMGSNFKTFINEGSLNFYEAPAVALIFLDECFYPDRLLDVGAFTAYLILAAEAHGLAACPIGLVKAYEDEVKDCLNVAESKVFVISVAIGKPDIQAPVNRFVTSRAPLGEFVRWID